MMENIVFTPSAVLDLLTQIEELYDTNISMTETFDNRLQLEIGNSIYILSNDTAQNVDVPSEVVEAIEDVNQDAYKELADSGTVDLQEPVESGIIKEIGKTLLLGGLVRLTGKLLK